MTPEHQTQLRIKIAEFLGWTFITSDGVGIPPKLLQFDARQIPDYPGDLNAAWQLVEHMRKEGWQYHLLECFENEDQHTCEFYKTHIGMSAFEESFVEAAETPSLAICLAFAKATGIPIPDLNPKD